LEAQGKACLHADWLTRTYTPDDFLPGLNIGLKQVNGLVDVDNDCAEAVHMANVLLPKTHAIYGRVGHARSHWLYTCAALSEPLILKDLITKTTLAEIRVKHQSMCPPSVHPDGETVAWEHNPPSALEVERDALVRTMRLVGTGAMICRHYNPPGARHDWSMALAGVLRKLGLTEAETTRIFTAAAQWVKDGDVKDRVAGVRSTFTLSEDVPVTGSKRLEELIGDTGKDFVASLHKIWGEAAAGVSKNKLDEMNAVHALLFNQGGRVCIMSEMQEDGQLQIRYTPKHEFELLHTEKVQIGTTGTGKPQYTTLARAWLDHPKRRSYNGIELAPNGHANAGYYNLWRGFAVEPKQGDWTLFRQHLMLLVAGKPEHLAYVLTWLAETVQHPERQIGIALAFKGGQGVGKSTFAKWFGALFGCHFVHLDSEHRLLGNFNAHLHNKIVVLADEAVWAGGKAGLGALKRMITEDSLNIERKGLDILTVRNMLHMIVASNEDWFVPAGFDDRRFAIFKVSDAQQNNDAFFGAVHAQLFQQGGLSALLYDLLEHKSDINLRHIPQTEERQTQKEHSMSARHQWWHEQLIDGSIWESAIQMPSDGDGQLYYEVDPEPLYRDYLIAVKQADGRINAGLTSAVSRFLKTIVPEGYPRVIEHDRKRFWIMPSLQACRSYFEQKTKIMIEWPEDATLFPLNLG
jgi:hypothetical protein